MYTLNSRANKCLPRRPGYKLAKWVIGLSERQKPLACDLSLNRIVSESGELKGSGHKRRRRSGPERFDFHTAAGKI